jgi:hypothetical protein
MLYRRSGKSAWDSVQLQEEDKYLKASVKPLKTGTVAEYYSELTYESNHYRIPANSNVSIVYKGNRPASVMNVLYFFLFGGLLLSVRGALEYFNAEDKKILFSFLSAIFFFIASIVFYPFIKSYELNVINKSVPSFSSLFDIQLVLLFIIWFLATILLFRYKNKIIILLAGIITIVVYQFSNFF